MPFHHTFAVLGVLRIARSEAAIDDTTVVYPRSAARLDGSLFIVGEL
jgi:hypothetical protein